MPSMLLSSSTPLGSLATAVADEVTNTAKMNTESNCLNIP